jgi:hypothetical protein
MLPLLVVAAFAAMTFAGCMTANAATGSAAVFVKDAPADDVSHLYVTFDKVEVHKMAQENETRESDNETAEGNERDNETAEHSQSASSSQSSNETESRPGTGHVAIAIQVREDSDDEREEGQWLTVLDQNTTVDLKAFNGTASAFLGGADVPAGAYNGIRLSVVAAHLVLKDGTSANVTVPSHKLRIVGHFTVEAGKETQLTLDFDLERSLHQTGNGKWMLMPVLRLEGAHRDRPSLEEMRERERERTEEDRRDRDDWMRHEQERTEQPAR